MEKRPFLTATLVLTLTLGNVFADIPERLIDPPTKFANSSECRDFVRTHYRNTVYDWSGDQSFDTWYYREYFSIFEGSGGSWGTNCTNNDCIYYYGMGQPNGSPIAGGCALANKFGNYDFWPTAHQDLVKEIEHYNTRQKSLPATTYGVQCYFTKGNEANRYDNCELVSKAG